MPTVKPASCRRLHKAEGARTLATLAAQARIDTLYGGAKALVIAERLERMGTRLPALEVVSSVYSASTGKHSEQWEAWECLECGAVHLGSEAAMQCCAPVLED